MCSDIIPSPSQRDTRISLLPPKGKETLARMHRRPWYDIPMGLSPLSLAIHCAYLQGAQKTIFAQAHEIQQYKTAKLNL